MPSGIKQHSSYHSRPFYLNKKSRNHKKYFHQKEVVELRNKFPSSQYDNQNRGVNELLRTSSLKNDVKSFLQNVSKEHDNKFSSYNYKEDNMKVAYDIRTNIFHEHQKLKNDIHRYENDTKYLSQKYSFETFHEKISNDLRTTLLSSEYKSNKKIVDELVDNLLPSNDKFDNQDAANELPTNLTSKDNNNHQAAKELRNFLSNSSNNQSDNQKIAQIIGDELGNILSSDQYKKNQKLADEYSNFTYNSDNHKIADELRISLSSNTHDNLISCFKLNNQTSDLWTRYYNRLNSTQLTSKSITQTEIKLDNSNDIDNQSLVQLHRNQRIQTLLTKRHESHNWWQIESKSFPKDHVLALGNYLYLLLVPNSLSITTGHCLLVPIQPLDSFRNGEEGVWNELHKFRQSLKSLFGSSNQGFIYLETVIQSKIFHQTRMDCIPVPHDIESDACMYFKAAFMDCSETMNPIKELTDDNGLCQVIPNNFPYFMVSWGSNNGSRNIKGYVYSIEEYWELEFGRNVVRSMLGVDTVGKYERNGKYNGGEILGRKEMWLMQKWKSVDWTMNLE